MLLDDTGIFYQLWWELCNHRGGYVTLNRVIQPLYGDADLIAKFWNDVDDSNAEDTATEWFDPFRSVQVFDMCQSSSVYIPPRPGTVTNALEMTPDGLYYADPAAASAFLAGGMKQAQEQGVPELFQSLPTDPDHQAAYLNLASQGIDPRDQPTEPSTAATISAPSV